MKTRTNFLLLLFLATCLVLSIGCDTRQSGASGNNASGNDSTSLTNQQLADLPVGCNTRIISLAPSITETLYALDLGDQVIGVTAYCNYPPEAAEKPAVASYMAPNLEAITAMRPDLVILLIEDQQTKTTLDRLGIETLVVNHQTIPGILDSITAIGDQLARTDRADTLHDALTQRLDVVSSKLKIAAPVRVLAVIDRPQGLGRITEVYAAGSSPFFNKALDICHAENVLKDTPIGFPVVSIEGIITTDPDVILDLSVRLHSSPETNDNADDNRNAGNNDEQIESALMTARRQALDDWQTLAGQVRAVRNDHVFIIDDDFASVPGPRSVDLVEKMARLLHPECYEEKQPENSLNPAPGDVTDNATNVVDADINEEIK